MALPSAPFGGQAPYPGEHGGCQSSSGRAVSPPPGNHGEHGTNETYEEEGDLHGAPSESGSESYDQEQKTCGGEPSRDNLLFPKFHGKTSSFLVGGVLAEGSISETVIRILYTIRFSLACYRSLSRFFLAAFAEL
jgi:hypothetical protein